MDLTPFLNEKVCCNSTSNNDDVRHVACRRHLLLPTDIEGPVMGGECLETEVGGILGQCI